MRKRFALKCNLSHFFLFNIKNSHMFVSVQVIVNSFVLSTTNHLSFLFNFIGKGFGKRIFFKDEFKQLIHNRHFLTHDCLFTFSSFWIRVMILKHCELLSKILRKIKSALYFSKRFVIPLLNFTNLICHKQTCLSLIEQFA